ncbi:MAG: hypothetical protein ACT4PT_08400, partial [Methanobacteriota archaeon]
MAEWSPVAIVCAVASSLLFLLSILFLRARRTEFTIGFAMMTAASGLQKGLAGVWLYTAPDPGLGTFAMNAAFLLWLPVLGSFVHAMVALPRGARPLPWAARIGIYLPFAAFAPWAISDPQAFITNAGAVPFFWLFVCLNVPFLAITWTVWRTAATEIARTEAKFVFLYLAATFPLVAEGFFIFVAWNVLPLWELAAAYTVATLIMLNGALKHEVFAIDLYARRATFSTALTTACAVAFLVVGEVLESRLGTGGGGGVVTA